MPTMDAMMAMANAQKEFVQANKDQADKIREAAIQLGSQNASRISQGRQRAVQNEASEIGARAEKSNIPWDSSIGLAAATANIAKGVNDAANKTEGASAKIAQALTQAAGVIANAVSKSMTLQKEIEKADRLKREGGKDEASVQVTGL